MPYKTMSAILRGESDTPRLVERMLPLIRAFGAHVTGIHAEPSPAAHVAVLAGDLVSVDEGAIEASRARMERVRTIFNDLCRREGISHDFRGMETFSGDSATASLASANAADLVVVQQADPDEIETMFADLETLLFDSGRPVLVLPYVNTAPVDPKHVVIAWKPTKEAARAVFDALPLLHRAESVEILVVDGKETPEHSAAMIAADIATALDRHGIRVNISNQISAGVPIGDVIENRVADTGVDLVVMGAYSHSPLRELLFGGVTRTLLKSMTVPVLMSH
ncbi:MAG: universal stress protein [Nitratireductor sp.]|nr:universal stress protein [Nitratireductor sp.]